MSTSRHALPLGLALALVGGGTALADALVRSDEEALAELLDAVASAEGPARVDALLGWAHAEGTPVTVSAEGRRARYDDDGALAEALHEALEGIESGALEVVQASTDVRGDDARLTTRLRAGEALVDLELSLRREGQGFALTSVRAL